MFGRPVPLLLAVAAWMFPAFLAAQAPPNIDDLYDRPTLAPEDRERIGQWVASRLETMKVAAQEGNTERLSGTLREVLARIGRASAAFTEELAGQVSTQSIPLITGANPVLSRKLAELNGGLDHPRTAEGLLAALQSADVLTRYYAAAGLRRLATRLDLVSVKVLNQLEQSVRNEPHRLVRQRMLEAMLLPNRAEESLATVARALLSSLDRLAQAPGAELSAESAFMLRLAEPAAGVRNASQRTRVDLVKSLAAVLSAAVSRDAAGRDQGSDRTEIERLLVNTEAVLRLAVREEIGGTPPDVSGLMMSGGPDVAAGMRAELAKWVGDQNSKGLLNSPPWNVPVGGTPQP